MGNERHTGRPTTRRYLPEDKARAVRLVRQLRKELGTSHGTIRRVRTRSAAGGVAADLGQAGRHRRWCRAWPDLGRGEADPGAGAGEPGAAPGERSAEAGLGFLRGGARPPIEVIVEFVHEHRTEFGVEFICRQLQVAPSSYYAARSAGRAVGAGRADALMMQVLFTLRIANRKVYGAHKLWKAAQRAGHDVGRDQVARLMGQLAVEEVSAAEEVFTTRGDLGASRAPDLVNRVFTADRPDALWVTDLTYVPTRSGCTCASSSTRSAAASWAGGWRRT